VRKHLTLTQRALRSRWAIVSGLGSGMRLSCDRIEQRSASWASFELAGFDKARHPMSWRDLVDRLAELDPSGDERCGVAQLL
jgi:hypothetical protein